VIEAAVLGRVGIDLYPNELATPLRDVRTYTRFVGGFAGNVATGLARLGVRAAIVSRVGDDARGEFVRRWLVAEGVDVRFLRTHAEWLTPPTSCEVWPPVRFPILFYRRPTALDFGDAFAAAVGYGLLRGLALVDAVRLGNVAGAIVASQLACSEAMPRLEDLEEALV
jgi:sugar/nucleoside kinase (ribokinase family)